MKWHGTCLYGAHRTRRDGSSFMWHQPCQRCRYTTSVDIPYTNTHAHTHTHIPKDIVDRFYIALSNRLTALACDSSWVTNFSIARFWLSTEMVYLQRWHGWCHMKLLPSRRVLCTSYNHAPCHFMQSQIRNVLAYLSVTCHLHFQSPGFLRATSSLHRISNALNRKRFQEINDLS